MIRGGVMHAYPFVIEEYKVKGKIFAPNFDEAVNILSKISFGPIEKNRDIEGPYMIPAETYATVALSRKPE